MSRQVPGVKRMNPRLAHFPWPPLPDSADRPRWTGKGFKVGQTDQAVLRYADAQSNWNPELTELHEAEAGSNHPIDRASRALAIRTLQRFAPAGEIVILDVGCSSGFVLDELQRIDQRFIVMGSDFIVEPLLKLAQRLPEVPLLQFDLRQCPLPNECVEAVTALNVLEHIAEHEQALAEIWRILKPGGVAHIEVPAGPHLYDIYDERLLHHRRYRLADLETMCRKCGFEVLKATHLGALVYPAFAWTKRRNRRALKLNAAEKKRIVAKQIRSSSESSLLRLLLQLEEWGGRVASYPFGIRCIMVVRKPHNEAANA